MPKILVAECTEMLPFLKTELEAAGFDVTLTDYVEGIEKAMAKETFDLIAMEPFLPCCGSIDGEENHSGLKVFERVISQKVRPLVIVKSTFAFVHPPEWYLEKGAEAVIPTPYRIPRLIEAIKQVLADPNAKLRLY